MKQSQEDLEVSFSINQNNFQVIELLIGVVMFSAGARRAQISQGSFCEVSKLLHHDDPKEKSYSHKCVRRDCGSRYM